MSINENLGKLVQHARDKKPTDFKEVLTSELDTRIEAGISEIRADLSKNMFKGEKEIAENCEGHPDGVEHTHDDGTVHTHEGGDKPHTHDEEVEEGTLPPALQKAIDAKKKKGGDDDEEEQDEGKASDFSGHMLGGNPMTTKEKAKRKAERDAKKKAGKKGKKEEVTDEGSLPPALQKAIDAKKKNNSDDDDEDKSPVGKKDENIANFGNKRAKAFTDDDNPTDNKKKKDKKEDIRDVAKRILRGK